MSVRQITSREVCESDRIERLIRRDTKKVSRTWYKVTLTATMSALVQIILTLIVLAELVFGKIKVCTVGLTITKDKLITDVVTATIVAITILVLVLSEMPKIMVNTMWVVYRILEIILLEIFHTINEVFGIDFIMVMSDQTRNQIVDHNKVYMAAMARKTLNMELLRQQTVTKRDTLTATQNAIISKCINKKSIIACEEKPETSVRIFIDNPQSNVEDIEKLTGNDSNTGIVDLVSLVYSPSTNLNVSCRVDKLAKWRRQRFFTDDEATNKVTQSNVQDIEELTGNDSNTRIADLVFPVSSPDVKPAVSNQVDKMAKWRPWRYFIAKTPNAEKPSIRHNKPTQYHHRWRGPNVNPRVQSAIYSRTQNFGFNSYVPRMFIPTPRPSFGQFWNGHSTYGVSFRPRIEQFRQGYWANGMYTVPTMFHQWPQTTIGQRNFGQQNGFHL